MEEATPDVAVAVKPIVSSRTKKGRVNLEIGDAKIQLSVQHARDVALLILDGAMAAESDEAAFAAISEQFDDSAAAIILPYIRLHRTRIQDAREADRG